MSDRRTVSRRVTATGYEEAMHLAVVDWTEFVNADHTRNLISITISENYDPGWRTVRGHLRQDFAVVFEFDFDLAARK